MAALAFLTLPLLFELAVAGLVFQVLRMLYRLTFHPLARFPGPKLAGATNLYAASYDLFGGTYVFELPELHARYGPIVRAWPDQLHIQDMDSYNQIYRSGTKFDKSSTFYVNPIGRGSTFNVGELKLAKPRKDMYQSSFSKTAIQRVESLIQGQVAKFLDILKQAAADDKAVNLSYGYRCLTADVIMMYCYQKPFGAMDAPDFKFPLMLALQDFFPLSQWPFYFPVTFNRIYDISAALPLSIAKKLLPALAAAKGIQNAGHCHMPHRYESANTHVQSCGEQIQYLKKRPKSSKGSFPTIFDTALNPDPSKGQFTPSDYELTADAVLMFGAGTDTTAHTLGVATWHILNEPRILQRIKDELRQAMPDKNDTLDWATLEDLPYLRAIIKESLRLSYGAPGRLPRVVPPSGATFCGRAIPPGTVVCHSQYVYHHDESIFPDSASFLPERWLDDKAQELDKHMLSFSRGSRSCLGMNLAYAELYLTLAHLFRRFDLSIHETTAKDMAWRDRLVPITLGHLKVRVRETET